MKTLWKILKYTGIALLTAAALLTVLVVRIFTAPMAPKNYTEKVAAGGEIEARYLAMGGFRVNHTQAEAPGDWKKFHIWYPAALEEGGEPYPAVVLVNGTGVGASRYKAVFRHLASWGFIVLGTEDPSTCTGDSADAALAYLLEENENPDSVFFGMVDVDRIGISGHSQGAWACSTPWASGSTAGCTPAPSASPPPSGRWPRRWAWSTIPIKWLFPP